MATWEIAILRCIDRAKGSAALSDVYAEIDSFKELSPHHQESTEYGGRPAYQHQIRRHITNLCRKGDLTRKNNGSYAITNKGRSRARDFAWMNDHEFGTAADYLRAFETILAEGIPDNQLALLRAHFAAPDHTATWAQLAAAVGYADGNAVNLQYGTLARRVATLLEIDQAPKRFWLYVLAGWADERDVVSGHTAFVLRRPVIAALKQLGVLAGPAGRSTQDRFLNGRRQGRAHWSPAPMDEDQSVVYFNNCHNRDHVALFGSGAFFDLGSSGRQGTQARNLHPGQTCVVAERAFGNKITFNWYSFTYEALLPDEKNLPDRVFFGRFLTSETLPKARAARSERYSALFKSNGDLKNGSVFHRVVPVGHVPPEIDEANTHVNNGSTGSQVGGGFGDPIENKIVESAAIRAVVRAYEEDGWSVRSVERDKCGFDLECSKKGVVENVEVKGVRATETCFIITAGEVEQARKSAKFVLIVVTSALSASPKLTKYSGAEFCRRFDLSAIQYRAVLKS